MCKLKSRGITDCGYYVGGMKQSALNISAKKSVILGTYQMAEEGLDIPDLDTIVLATPRSDVEQSVGRILRNVTGKKGPVVVDIVDPNPMLLRMAEKRSRQYRNLNFTVEEHRIGAFENEQ